MQTTRLIRCDVTKNPVGTDARMIGEPPCDCQGCFCARLIDDLQADLRNVLKAALYNEPNGADLVYRLTTFALKERHPASIEKEDGRRAQGWKQELFRMMVIGEPVSVEDQRKYGVIR